MNDRYDRHRLIDWLDQDAVHAERIVVVGAGAVGNEVVKNLTLLGVGEIHVFDFDMVELHNLTRSVLFRESDLGRSKVDCVVERARELDPAVRLHAHQGDFWRQLRFPLLQASTAVFCCVDNLEARIRLSRLCAIAGVPLVNVGIDSRSIVVEHFPFGAGAIVPCYECGLPLSAYTAIAKRYSCGWLRRVAEEQRGIPTTILTSSVAAGLAVSAHVRPEPVTTSTRIFLDTVTGHSTVTELERRSSCPGCGDLQEPREILPSQRSLGSGLSPSDGPIEIRSSDRILVSYRCLRCASDTTPSVVFRLAEEFDETFATCPDCGTASRQIDVRDGFSVQDLTELAGVGPMPGKYLMCDLNGTQVVLELEG